MYIRILINRKGGSLEILKYLFLPKYQLLRFPQTYYFFFVLNIIVVNHKLSKKNISLFATS